MCFVKCILSHIINQDIQLYIARETGNGFVIFLMAVEMVEGCDSSRCNTKTADSFDDIKMFVVGSNRWRVNSRYPSCLLIITTNPQSAKGLVCIETFNITNGRERCIDS